MLIYCCYPTLTAQEPEWAGLLAQNPGVVRDGWAVYRPWLSFGENLKQDPGACRVSAAQLERLRLDPDIAAPLSRVAPRIAQADQGAVQDVHFKRLWVLARADVVVWDLCGPGWGGAACEALYGYLLGIPVIGVSNRFVLPPAATQMVASVVWPSNTDQIACQVRAHTVREPDGDNPSPDPVPREGVPDPVQ